MKWFEEALCKMFTGHVWELHDDIDLRMCAKCHKIDKEYGEGDSFYN